MGAMKRQPRELREKAAQYVALGVLFATGRMDDVDATDFLDSEIAALVDAMKRNDASTASTLRHFAEDKLGVYVEDSEKMRDGVLRTVKENAERERIGRRIQTLALSATNWSLPDGDFKKQVAALAGEVM